MTLFKYKCDTLYVTIHTLGQIWKFTINKFYTRLFMSSWLPSAQIRVDKTNRVINR